MRSAHSEGIQIHSESEKWDKTTHTTLTECSALGKINFLDEDTTIQPEVKLCKFLLKYIELFIEPQYLRQYDNINNQLF